MRIADVLSDRSDDEGGEKFGEGKRKSGDFDPSFLTRSLFSRLFPRNYSFRVIKRKKKAEAGAGLDADPPAGTGEAAVVDPASDSEARRSKQLSIDSGASVKP